MKISKLPDGHIEIRDMRSARCGAGDLVIPADERTYALGVLTMSREEFARLIVLGSHLELAPPACIFIEG